MGVNERLSEQYTTGNTSQWHNFIYSYRTLLKMMHSFAPFGRRFINTYDVYQRVFLCIW